MNVKAVLPLVAGLGIAGFAAKMGLDQIRAARGEAPKVVQLWTVSQTLSRGGQINEEMLEPLIFPVDSAPADAIVDKKRIVGRVPAVDVTAKLPILQSMLHPPGTIPGIQVPDGFRAVAVKIDESSGVDNHLQPGAWVDVVGMFQVRSGDGGRTQTVAKTLIENVQVAAVGQRMTPNVGGEDSSKNSRNAPRQARAATLLVKPEQVPSLHLAEQRGKIKLSLRSNAIQQSNEFSTVADRVVNEDDLLGERKQEVTDGLGGMFGKWLGGFTPDPNPEPAPMFEPPPEPEPEPQPEIIWTMTVMNGDDRIVLGWTAENPFEPIELASGGANIFQDRGWDARPGRKPAKAGKPASKPARKPVGRQPQPIPPHSDPIPDSFDDPNDGDVGIENLPEPKELFE